MAEKVRRRFFSNLCPCRCFFTAPPPSPVGLRRDSFRAGNLHANCAIPPSIRGFTQPESDKLTHPLTSFCVFFCSFLPPFFQTLRDVRKPDSFFFTRWTFSTYLGFRLLVPSSLERRSPTFSELVGLNLFPSTEHLKKLFFLVRPPPFHINPLSFASQKRVGYRSG